MLSHEYGSRSLTLAIRHTLYFVQLRIAKVKRGQRFQRFSTCLIVKNCVKIMVNKGILGCKNLRQRINREEFW